MRVGRFRAGHPLGTLFLAVAIQPIRCLLVTYAKGRLHEGEVSIRKLHRGPFLPRFWGPSRRDRSSWSGCYLFSSADWPKNTKHR